MPARTPSSFPCLTYSSAVFPLIPNVWPTWVVPIMLRSTWNVWALVGLLSRCLDHDNTLVTHDESRVGSAVILDKGISVFGDFDYSGFVGCGCQRFAPCKGSGIGSSGVRVRGSRTRHSEFATKNLVVSRATAALCAAGGSMPLGMARFASVQHRLTAFNLQRATFASSN